MAPHVLYRFQLERPVFQSMMEPVWGNNRVRAREKASVGIQNRTVGRPATDRSKSAPAKTKQKKK